MENVEPVNSYLGILQIREKAYQRNLIFAGSLFLVGLVITIAMLLLTDWNVRTVIIVTFVDISLLLSYMMSWTRLEITRQNIELVKNLQLRGR